MSQQAGSIEGTRRVRPETSAWLMLLSFFMIFCAIVAAGGYTGWRYYNFATLNRDGLLRVHVNAGVTFQARGDARAVSLERSRNPCFDSDEICKPISKGDRVNARPEAGYGPVASVVLPDQTQIDLWAHPAGADLVLESYQVTRWTNRRQEVVFRQAAGYARYDVKDTQPYEDVRYTIEITRGVQVLLGRGGSYSINVPHPEPGKPPAPTATGAPMLVEVAARSGHAEVRSERGSVTLKAGEKVQVDLAGTMGTPLASRWELIRDGDFRQLATKTGTNAVETWSRYWILTAPDLAPEERNSDFSIVRTCRPETPNFCTGADQAYIGRFRREGNQQKSFGTGITQTLDADVSEYRSLHFSAWVRVVRQTVAKAGIAGSECPITIQFVYKQKSPTDRQQNRYFCVYSDETNTEIERGESEFSYRGVPQYQWYHLNYELRDDPSLKQAYYLQTISIYANGHDYVSEITDISLIGAQR